MCLRTLTGNLCLCTSSQPSTQWPIHTFQTTIAGLLDLPKFNMTVHHPSFWHLIIVFWLLCISIPTAVCYNLPLPLLLVKDWNNTHSLTKNWKLSVFKTGLMTFSLAYYIAKSKHTILVNTEGKGLLTAAFFLFFFPFSFEFSPQAVLWHLHLASGTSN